MGSPSLGCWSQLSNKLPQIQLFVVTFAFSLEVKDTVLEGTIYFKNRTPDIKPEIDINAPHFRTRFYDIRKGKHISSAEKKLTFLQSYELCESYQQQARQHNYNDAVLSCGPLL